MTTENRERDGETVEQQEIPLGVELPGGRPPRTVDQLAGELLFSGLRKAVYMSLPEVLTCLAAEYPAQEAGLRAASLLLQLRGAQAAQKAVASRQAKPGRKGRAAAEGD
jgi:hypothetical protein